jgi:hypothetical protein
MNREKSKHSIENLVQTFRFEKREKINEAETRLRFIDPFFEALGWDIKWWQISLKRVMWFAILEYNEAFG